MNTFYSLLLVAVSLALGVVVGETMAPISGITVQAVAAREAVIEARLIVLEAKYEALSTIFFGPVDAGR